MSKSIYSLLFLMCSFGMFATEEFDMANQPQPEDEMGIRNYDGSHENGHLFCRGCHRRLLRSRIQSKIHAHEEQSITKESASQHAE